MRSPCRATVASALWVAHPAAGVTSPLSAAVQQRPRYGGDNGNTKYAALPAIGRDKAPKRRVAWRWAREPALSVSYSGATNSFELTATTREPRLSVFDKTTGTLISETDLPANAGGSLMTIGLAPASSLSCRSVEAATPRSWWRFRWKSREALRSLVQRALAFVATGPDILLSPKGSAKHDD